MIMAAKIECLHAAGLAEAVRSYLWYIPLTKLADLLALPFAPPRPPDRMVGVSASESDTLTLACSVLLPGHSRLPGLRRFCG